MDTLYGNIHSIQTLGTVDGPGIRYVIFFQGCPLRCQYCHNPDTWALNQGEQMSATKIIEDLLSYKSYFDFSNGGVTFSGGEPMLQAEFILELVKQCKIHSIHTAIDTSGFIFNDCIQSLLNEIDLVLLDIKHFDKEQFKHITGVPLDNTLKTLNYLRMINKKVWIRYVLVPTLSDSLKDIDDLAAYLEPFSNIEYIEILPFHKQGEYKWLELSKTYQLSDINEPSESLIHTVLDIFSRHNLKALINQ